MKRSLMVWMAAAGLLVSGSALAAADLQVQLDGPAQKADFASGKIRFTLRNTGNQSVRVLRWRTPMDHSLGEGLTAPLFEIDDLKGRPVPYVGKLAKRAAPGPGDYETIAPGQLRTVTVDLSADYDMSAGGQYAVRYAQPEAILVDPQDAAAMARSRGVAAPAADREVASNALNLWVDTGPDPLGRALRTMGSGQDAVARASGGNSFVSCSSSRQSALGTARNSSVTYANNAKSYLSAGSAGSRYTYWFGSYTSSRYSTATSHFNKIASALSTASYTFDCSCTDSGTYAYVYPDQPYRVYLCGAFWSAPNTGTDSRAGTLIHETSHFTVVAGTDDHVYGQSGAHNLAGSNPDQALDNADNHEYFGENNPARN